MQSIFDLTGAATFAGDFVIREGKIFEAGNYPDKNFEMTPDELRRAAAEFQPVPVDLEHTPTVLDGKLGMLQGVRVAADGRSLYGTVALPRWLDSMLKDGERKVSCTWNRLTKRLIKLALVLNPRVADAALMAAFAQRHDTPHGQSLLQMMHDQAARAGAVCAAPAQSADMHSAHELRGIQEMHDVAVKHGAGCAERATSPYFSEGQPLATEQVAQQLREQGRRFIEQHNAGLPTTAQRQTVNPDVRAQAQRFIGNYNRQYGGKK